MRGWEQFPRLSQQGPGWGLGWSLPSLRYPNAEMLGSQAAHGRGLTWGTQSAHTLSANEWPPVICTDQEEKRVRGKRG